MKVIYTDQSLIGLEESLQFLIDEYELPLDKVIALKDRLLDSADSADSLALNPYKGQQEEYLKHLNEGHRRLVEGHFKIIYKVEGKAIYITDFFDSRQYPAKMKG